MSVSTQLPVKGPQPGGKTGKTRGLDHAVTLQAAWLVKTFGRDVEIRYTSDQMSGGAWVTDPAAENNGVGLIAKLLTPDMKNREMRRFYKQGRRIVYAVYMDIDFIRKRLQKLCGDGQPGVYGYFVCERLRDARLVLLSKLNNERLPEAS